PPRPPPSTLFPYTTLFRSDFEHPGEYAIGRPCVRRDGDRYRMWYCYRGDAYRIGYAESADGLTWIRKDHEFQLTGPSAGFDVEIDRKSTRLNSSHDQISYA